MGSLNFLNTGLLAFTAATLLPLLIWLLAKRKPKRIVFPTLRFIKASQEEEKKRTRLKNILLLIIRMLIVLLVTLAAARPLLRSRHLKPAREHPPTAIAILLDTSFSMDYLEEGKSNLDRAKEAIRQINALCTPQDRLIPITSDADWNRLHAQTYASKVPEDLLNRIRITYSPLRFTDLLALAQEKLRETQLANREMYLLTDGQRQEYPAGFGERLHVIRLGRAALPANLSCSEAGILPQLAEKSRRQSLGFKLTNHGSSDRREVLVKVVLDGAKVAEKFVDLPARQTVNQNISVDLGRDGWQSGYVEVVDDRLEHDNRSYFAFPFQLAPSVAVISERQEIPAHLLSLLQVYAGAEGRIDPLAPQQLSRTALGQYQGLVFLANGSLSPKLRELIAALQESGRGALFCLGRDLSAEYKSFLGGLFGVSFGAFQSQPQTLDYSNPHHFTTQLMQGTNTRFNQLAGFWRLEGSGGTALLKGGRENLALARDKLALWNFDLADTRSTFLLDAAFAVFAYRCLEFTGSVIAAGEKYRLGDSMNAHKLSLPDGTTLLLAGQPHKLALPGAYQLEEASGASRGFSVDPPREESDFQLQNFEPFKYIRLLDKNWQSALFHTRLGHDLWKLLLAAALALFLLELILVKTEELRPAAAGKGTESGSNQ